MNFDTIIEKLKDYWYIVLGVLGLLVYMMMGKKSKKRRRRRKRAVRNRMNYRMPKRRMKRKRSKMRR